MLPFSNYWHWYFQYCRTNNAETSLAQSEICDETGIAKRRKMSSQELDVGSINGGGSECSANDSKDEYGGKWIDQFY